MTKEEIKQYLGELNDELQSMNVRGEICLYGGAVMALVYDARPNTKDVDAVFRPAAELRKAAARVAEAHGLRPDWLNDAVKGFVVPHKQRIFLDLSNLKVFVPEADYLLAMKAIAARVDYDKDDVRLLIESMELKSADEVFEIVQKYYPKEQIRPATQFFIEEIFQS